MKTALVQSIGASLLLIAATACSILPESETVQLLDPGLAAPDAGADPAPWSLNVTRPETDPMRDSTRVLVRTGQGRLQVHPRARWVTAPPELLRTQLVRYMRDGQRLEQVSAGAAGLDRTLALDLRRFELEERASGALAARVTIEARLYDSRSIRLLARRVFEAGEDLDGDGPDRIVAGFESSLGELVPALADWVVETGEPAASD